MYNGTRIKKIVIKSLLKKIFFYINNLFYIKNKRKNINKYFLK